MGKSQRDKGYRGERAVVKFLQAHGISAKRVPLSGAAEGFPGDVIVADKYTAEVKWRKNGFKELYKWLEGKDLAFLKADRKPFLVVMTGDMFCKIIGGSSGGDEK